MEDGISDGDTRWGLILAFDDESPSFTHGFEAGQIYAAMKSAQAQIERTVHRQNESLFVRMAGRMGYDITITPTEIEGWIDICCVKQRPASHLFAVS